MLGASSGGKSRPRVIRIHLFRNGDANFKGVVMRFESKKYTSFMSFLEDVTTLLRKDVFIHSGGVKNLYTTNGIKVQSLLNIEDNEMYVATCLQEKFKDAPYNIKAQPPPSTPNATPYTPKESVHSVCLSKSLANDHMQTVESVLAKRITIVRAGNRPRKIARVLLNSRNAHDFERVMTVINDATKFDSGPLHRLYTLGGKLVTSLDDIFGRHFIFFSFRKEAICLGKDLQLTEDEVQAVMQLNKSPNSDKIDLKEPPRREPENTRVTPQIALKYDLSKRIGTGRYSSIYICSNKMRKEDERYAMKIARKNRTTFVSLIQELQILRGIRHPNIVRLFSNVDSASEVYLRFELLDRDLKSLLNEEGKIEESEAKVFTNNILSALFYLHCLKIVHRGVSTSNLMVKNIPSGVRQMKLIDFGLACRCFKPLFEICNETSFMAPEMLKEDGYGEKVDVWAAGVVLYYMLSLSAPFLGHTEDEDKRLIVEEQYDTSSEAWGNISRNAKHIIGRMLCKNPAKRCSADNLLSHSWITGTSIDGYGNYDEGRSDGHASSSLSTSEAGSVTAAPIRNKKQPVRKEAITSKLRRDFKKGDHKNADDRSDGDVDSDWEDESVNDAFDCSEYEQEFEGGDSFCAGDGDSCSETRPCKS